MPRLWAGARPHRDASWCSRPWAAGSAARWRCWPTRGTCSPTSARSALSVLTAWIAQRPADETKTYGYLRWEILAALVNGAALFGIAGLGRGRGGAAHPAPRADPYRALPRGRRRRSGGQPGEPGPAARVAGGQPQRAGRLSARHGRRAGLGRRAGCGGDHLAHRLDPGRPDRLDRCSRCSFWSAPGGSCGRAPTSCSTPSPATSPCARSSAGILGVPGVAGGARPPRLDGGERRGGDERPCRGARTSRPTPACSRGSAPRCRRSGSGTSRCSSRWRTSARRCGRSRPGRAPGTGTRHGHAALGGRDRLEQGERRACTAGMLPSWSGRSRSRRGARAPHRPLAVIPSFLRAGPA